MSGSTNIEALVSEARRELERARSSSNSWEESRRRREATKYHDDESKKIPELEQEIRQIGAEPYMYFDGRNPLVLHVQTPDWVIQAARAGIVVSYRNPDSLRHLEVDRGDLWRTTRSFKIQQEGFTAVRELIEYRSHTIEGENSVVNLCRQELWDRMGVTPLSVNPD